uniref:Uncharacterized protein n=1 Tax=Glossina palpalis gambiensis TaxID=67801 RepID=A0A1B0BRI0_9MUSC
MAEIGSVVRMLNITSPWRTCTISLSVLTIGFSSSELLNIDFIPSEQIFETFVLGLLASLASVVDDIRNKFVTFDVSVEILLVSVDDITGIVEVNLDMLSFNFACNFDVWLWFSPFSRSVVLLLYLEHLLNDSLTPHMFRVGGHVM